MEKEGKTNYKKIISYIIGLLFVLYESVFSLMLFVMLFIVVTTYDPNVKIFTAYNIINSLWVGLFSFLGADSLYKAFEGKIFTPYSDMNNIIEIDRG